MFAGRKILVTGASRGIGAELARQLIAQGATVIAAARHPQEGPGLIPYTVDLAKPGAPRALADWVRAHHPDTSGLINNAAIMVHTDLTEGDHDAEIAR